VDHAKINAVELGYEVLGSGEPMLFIHGSHIADALQPLVAEPALERFQRIGYHRRGLGGSTRPVEAEPTSVAVQAEDAIGLLDHLGVDRAHVVGHSLGGAIALELAAQHPTRVASLVLLEPVLLMTPAGAAFARALAPHDKDRRKTALVVLRILAPNPMAGANGLTVLRSWIVKVPATTDERPS
jgi:pimeloyl-ACP methyl ester carboxylesterase